DAAFTYQQALEKGTKKIVGVNVHTSTNARELEILRISHEVEVEQRETLAKRREARNGAAGAGALGPMASGTTGSDTIGPAMLDAVRAEATLGEICDTLRDLWGAYREPARF